MILRYLAMLAHEPGSHVLLQDRIGLHVQKYRHVSHNKRSTRLFSAGVS